MLAATTGTPSSMKGAVAQSSRREGEFTAMEPLNMVFEVLEEGPDASEFIGLSLLCSVAKNAAPSRITAELPKPDEAEWRRVVQHLPPSGVTQTPSLSLVGEVADAKGMLSQLESLQRLISTAESEDPSPSTWYAMNLIAMLVQKEQQTGNDNWTGLTSVLSLIDKGDQV